jgi:chromosome segregation ATPase
MCKKMLLMALAVGAGLFVLSSTRLGSYGQTFWGKIKHSAKQQVPLEFEIERVKQQVAQLVPDMKNNLTTVANEIVAVENLREEIKTAHANLAKQKTSIQTMTEELKSGNERVVFGGQRMTRTRMAEALAQNIRSSQRLEEEIKAREQLLEHKERALDSAREQLASIRSQKEQLEVEVARLEAELKAVRLAQTKSKFQFDDSKLAEIKRTLGDIRNRLRVTQVETDLQNQFGEDLTPTAERPVKSADEVIKQAEAYLSGSKGDTAVAGK